MAYSGSFAAAYDALNSEADIGGRTDFLLKQLKKHGAGKGIILDLACGTGLYGCIMEKKGYDVISVDISPDMLLKARENAEAQGCKNILFLCQDMSELDLYGTVDACICCSDSLNHLENFAALERTFGKVSLFMNPGGIFIFDMNTLYKHKRILAGNTFTYEQDGNFLVWQNSDCINGEITLFLDEFSDAGNGMYIRHSEEFTEKAYPVGLIKKTLKKSGFDILKIYGGFSEEKRTAVSDRVLFIAKKK